MVEDEDCALDGADDVDEEEAFKATVDEDGLDTMTDTF